MEGGSGRSIGKLATVTSRPQVPFGHVATAMITPFTDAGEVDHEKARRLARFLSDHGTDTLVVTGTTGESPTLSSGEKLALYKTVVDSVAEKDTKVVAGTGSYDTAASVELTRRAGDLGCDGVLAVTPYYNKPEQSGLIGHFKRHRRRGCSGDGLQHSGSHRAPRRSRDLGQACRAREHRCYQGCG